MTLPGLPLGWGYSHCLSQWGPRSSWGCASLQEPLHVKFKGPEQVGPGWAAVSFPGLPKKDL